MPIRTFIGIVLGWMVVHTGSIFPAMVTHAAYDITQLLHLSAEVRRLGTAALLDAARSGQGEPVNWPLIGGAIVLVILALLLLRASPSPAPRPPALSPA